jgi:hypothetical protein
MATQLSTKERLAIWKNVRLALLDYIKLQGFMHDSRGLCHFVAKETRILNRRDIEPSPETLRKNWPELHKYKPKTGWEGNHNYWWSPIKKRSHEHRLTIVDLIIDDLKKMQA